MSGGTAALEVVDGQLLRHDKQHTMLSGAIHYFRVHPDYWRDRLMRLRALGLNTIDTYIAWNFHQAQADSPADFTGWRDFEEFIRIAGDIGLDVVVRPGPYICAEWDNGGFPAWATARCPGTLRTSDPRFLQLVSTWFDELIPRIAALQTGNGGPVVAVQIENEYGSFGDDQAYLRWLRDALSQRGITELMFTADGPTELMLDGGMLAGSFAAMTLGSRPDRALELLRERRADQPMLVAEFWQGWFDHWGELHHVRTARSALCTLREILEAGGSVCLYMAHGGTNFGLRSGANHDGTVLQPTVTSYDSDAPVAESGALTSKFHDYRALFEEYAAAPLPALPAEPEVLPGRVLPLQPGMPLLDSLRSASSVVESVTPRSFEDLALDAGMLLYEAEPLIPQHGCDLNVTGLHDRATVFVDDEPVGVIDTENGSLRIPGPGRRVRLSLLVENLGRINYGPLLGQGKGILGLSSSTTGRSSTGSSAHCHLTGGVRPNSTASLTPPSSWTPSATPSSRCPGAKRASSGSTGSCWGATGPRALKRRCISRRRCCGRVSTPSRCWSWVGSARLWHCGRPRASAKRRSMSSSFRRRRCREPAALPAHTELSRRHRRFHHDHEGAAGMSRRPHPCD